MKLCKKCSWKGIIVIGCLSVLLICVALSGLTACNQKTDNSVLLQGIWEIDTGSGAGYKFDGNKFWWVKSVKDFDDNYWYGYVDISTGEKAMKMVGLTYDELQNSLPGMNKKNIFYTRLDPKIIFTDGEDKTSTNMTDATLFEKLWLVNEGDKKTNAVVIDIRTFKIENYIKVK